MKIYRKSDNSNYVIAYTVIHHFHETGKVLVKNPWGAHYLFNIGDVENLLVDFTQ